MHPDISSTPTELKWRFRDFFAAAGIRQPDAVHRRGDTAELEFWWDRELGERIAGPNPVQSSVDAQIVLLREYRTRLISDVVTGKLDGARGRGKPPGRSGLGRHCAGRSPRGGIV